MTPSRFLSDPARLMANRLSATDVGLDTTRSQSAAKRSSAVFRRREVQSSRSTASTRTLDACHWTVAVNNPSRSPNHL